MTPRTKPTYGTPEYYRRQARIWRWIAVLFFVSALFQILGLILRFVDR